MPVHIKRLITLLVIAGVVAIGAIKLLTAPTFYEYGHYRGASVAEIAADKPNYKGVAYCKSCHAERVAEWSKGVHNNVKAGKIVRCEICHGAAGNRNPGTLKLVSATPAEHPKNLKLIVSADSRKLCTLCHEKMSGRPAQQPQIVVAKHAGTQQCTVCHNPHSPMLNLASAATPAVAAAGDAAVGKAKAGACAGCHGADGVSVNLPGTTLAAQKQGYFVEALKAYSTGARDNAMMSPIAKGLSDKDMENLAAYYAAQKCESTLTADKQATATGREVAATCVGCHGANGVSNNNAWPNLIGQSKKHLLDALKAYKSGTRKNAMMAGVVKDLSDADIENAATYYASATCK